MIRYVTVELLKIRNIHVFYFHAIATEITWQYFTRPWTNSLDTSLGEFWAFRGPKINWYILQYKGLFIIKYNRFNY